MPKIKDKKKTEEQSSNRQKPKTEHLKPWQFKPGQTGNPGGRPAGPSMKEWSKTYLASLTEKERLEFLRGQNKLDIWKMGEGNPHTTEEHEVKGDLVINISEAIIKKLNESTDTPPNPEPSSGV